MTSRLLMTLQVVVAPPQKLGTVPHGIRAIALITSGTFDGPRLRGKVRPGGADWTLLRSDGVLELELRITLETDEGALIYMKRSRPDGARRLRRYCRAKRLAQGVATRGWRRQRPRIPSHRDFGRSQ